MKIERNVGTVGRAVRLGLGIGLIVGGYFYLADVVSLVAYVLGIILLLTGFFASCPVYSLLGMNTAGSAAPKTAPTKKSAKKRK